MVVQKVTKSKDVVTGSVLAHINFNFLIDKVENEVREPTHL